MTQFRAAIFYDAEWDGSAYSGGVPGGEVFDKDVTFEQFIERVYKKKEIDKAIFELRLYYVARNADGSTFRIPIVDDGDIKFATAENPVIIYANKFERVRSSHVGAHYANERGGEVHEQPRTNQDEVVSHTTRAVVGVENIILGDDPDFDDSDYREMNTGGMIDGIDDDRVDYDDRTDYDGQSDWENRDDGFAVGLNGGNNSIGVWELPGMDNYCFGETQEYALSTPHTIRALSKGAIFNSKEAMKLAIGKFALESKLSIHVHNSNNIRFEVVCTDWQNGCGFAFRARRGSKDFPLWHVTEFKSECTCLADPDRADRRHANAKVIGHLFSSRVSEANFAPANIISEVRARFSVQLFYSKAWRALHYARKVAYGSHDESWQLLPAYLHMLKVTNPGTIVAMETTDDGHFLYSFFALGQCIEGFKKYLRPVIATDATHLKGELSGVIFVAIGMDGAEMIYPIAFGFAPGESIAAWTWFLVRLRESIGLPEELVIVSDRGSSIPPAVRIAFPFTPHVFCYYHLKQNLLKFCRRRKDVQSALSKAVYTYSKGECDSILQTLATSCPNSYNELRKLGVQKWARSYCPRRRYTIMTTNIAESINKAILPARRLPITAAHEYLRHLVQKWVYIRSDAANKLDSFVTRAAINHINDLEVMVQKCQVYPIENSVKYEIKNTDDGDGIVNVQEMSCSCNK